MLHYVKTVGVEPMLSMPLRKQGGAAIVTIPPSVLPDGHFKFPHLWPVKFPQAGRLNYQLFGLVGSDFLSW